jgi:hypothetical protein
MNSLVLSNADTSAPLTVEVRADGILKRVSPGQAAMLVLRGWGEWIGSGRRRYVRLTDSAPLSSLHGWLGRDGTRPVRADQTCKVYKSGQAIGNPQTHREFIR